MLMSTVGKCPKQIAIQPCTLYGHDQVFSSHKSDQTERVWFAALSNIKVNRLLSEHGKQREIWLKGQM